MLVSRMVGNKLNKNCRIRSTPSSGGLQATAHTPGGTGRRAPDGGNAATIKSLGTTVSGEERATNVQTQQYGLSVP